jgi:hypothetical protein
MTEPKTQTRRAPAGLAAGGRALWREIAATHHLTLDAMQVVQLTEACRLKDRLDEMDRIIQGKGVLHLMQFRVGDVFEGDDERRVSVTVKFDAVIERANATANTMKQLLAALRLPDEASGARPQRRGPRGAQKPTIAGGATAGVSSLDRARARAEAKTGA